MKCKHWNKSLPGTRPEAWTAVRRRTLNGVFMAVFERLSPLFLRGGQQCALEYLKKVRQMSKKSKNSLLIFCRWFVFRYRVHIIFVFVKGIHCHGSVYMLP